MHIDSFIYSYSIDSSRSPPLLFSPFQSSSRNAPYQPSAIAKLSNEPPFSYFLPPNDPQVCDTPLVSEHLLLNFLKFL